MSQNRNGQDYSRYDEMTTEELEEILRADALLEDEDEAHTDLILHIMEVYAERKKDEPHKSAEEAYAEFERHYLPDVDESEDPSCGKKKRKLTPHRILRPFAAIAAVVVLVFCVTLTARSMGWNVWKSVAKWTNGVFYFEESSPISSEDSDDSAYKTIQKLIPTWIPDGFELVDEKLADDENITTYFCTYQRDEAELILIYQKVQEGKTELLEKNLSDVEEHKANGIVFYIFENNGSIKAVWSHNGFVCSISGDITHGQIIKMVESIK